MSYSKKLKSSFLSLSAFLFCFAFTISLLPANTSLNYIDTSNFLTTNEDVAISLKENEVVKKSNIKENQTVKYETELSKYYINLKSDKENLIDSITISYVNAEGKVVDIKIDSQKIYENKKLIFESQIINIDVKSTITVVLNSATLGGTEIFYKIFLSGNLFNSTNKNKFFYYEYKANKDFSMKFKSFKTLFEQYIILNTKEYNINRRMCYDKSEDNLKYYLQCDKLSDASDQIIHIKNILFRNQPSRLSFYALSYPNSVPENFDLNEVQYSVIETSNYFSDEILLEKNSRDDLILIYFSYLTTQSQLGDDDTIGFELKINDDITLLRIENDVNEYSNKIKIPANNTPFNLVLTGSEYLINSNLQLLSSTKTPFNMILSYSIYLSTSFDYDTINNYKINDLNNGLVHQYSILRKETIDKRMVILSLLNPSDQEIEVNLNIKYSYDDFRAVKLEDYYLTRYSVPDKFYQYLFLENKNTSIKSLLLYLESLYGTVEGDYKFVSKDESSNSISRLIDFKQKNTVFKINKLESISLDSNNNILIRLKKTSTVENDVCIGNIVVADYYTENTYNSSDKILFIKLNKGQSRELSISLLKDNSYKYSFLKLGQQDNSIEIIFDNSEEKKTFKKEKYIYYKANLTKIKLTSNELDEIVVFKSEPELKALAGSEKVDINVDNISTVRYISYVVQPNNSLKNVSFRTNKNYLITGISYTAIIPDSTDGNKIYYENDYLNYSENILSPTKKTSTQFPFSIIANKNIILLFKLSYIENKDYKEKADSIISLTISTFNNSNTQVITNETFNQKLSFQSSKVITTALSETKPYLKYYLISFFGEQKNALNECLISIKDLTFGKRIIYGGLYFHKDFIIKSENDITFRIDCDSNDITEMFLAISKVDESYSLANLNMIYESTPTLQVEKLDGGKRKVKITHKNYLQNVSNAKVQYYIVYNYAGSFLNSNLYKFYKSVNEKKLSESFFKKLDEKGETTEYGKAYFLKAELDQSFLLIAYDTNSKLISEYRETKYKGDETLDTDSSTAKSESSSSSTLTIVLSVLGAIIALALIVFLIKFWLNRRRMNFNAINNVNNPLLN